MERSITSDKAENKKFIPFEIILSLLITITAVFTSVFYDKSFFAIDMSDNYTISMVVNGLFAQDNYCVFISPILCGIIKFMCKILPKADNFALYMNISVYISLYAVTYFAVMRCVGKEKKLLCAVFILTMAAIVPSKMNFTVVSAFVSVCGFFILFLALLPFGNIRTRTYIIIGTLLVFMGMLIRPDVMFLILPFAVLHLIFHFISNINDKRKIRLTAAVTIPLILCAAAISAADNINNNSEKYSHAVRYSTARSDIFDWPQKEYGEIKDKLESEGISENDFMSVSLLMLGDTDRIDHEYLEKIVSISRKRPYNSFFGDFRDIVGKFAAERYGFKIYFVYVCDIAVLLYILLSDAKMNHKAEAVLAFMGIYAISFMLIYIGRFLDRLFFSAVLGAFSVHCAIIFGYDREKWKNDKRSRVLISTVVCILGVVSVLHYAAVDFSAVTDNVLTARVNADESIWRETYKDNDVFIWNPFDYINIPMGYFYTENKLPTGEFMMHHTFYGGLCSGQIYMKDYYSKIGLTNPARDLLYRENTYSVGSQRYQEMLLQYIREHIDANADVEKCGNIGYAEVWHFVSGSSKAG